MRKYITISLIAAVALFSSCEDKKAKKQEVIKETEAGTKLVDQVERGEGDEVVIPYLKYKLKNGLTLVIHEDDSDPIVHVDVTYHVGSAREELGRSGFAHFFEHMMFQGSDHVADEEHFKIISEAGGTLNGTTNSDRTNYFETVPSNYLEKVLWLEADRMGFLLDAVTQKKFEVQRSTVKNERNQRYDNRPYGLVREKVKQALYPFGHPYSWPVIGYIRELNWADVDDLKKFFLRWYGPNNATLTIAGDVDPKQVIELTEKYFGPIPAGPEVTDMKLEKVSLPEDRYISYEDNIRFPLLQFAFPTVPNRHPDEAPLDILSDILGGGKSSLFYQKFEKPQLAISASVSHPCQELAGQFELTVLPFPGRTLKEMEEKVREVIEDFEHYEITDDDMQRMKSQIEAQTINSLNSVSGKASMLAMYETFEENPDYIKEDMKRYREVTKEDVRRVFNEYIKGQNAVILSVYPKGQPNLVVKEDNFEPKFVDSTYVSDDPEYADLTYNKPEDNFDRSKEPESGPNPSLKLPDFWEDNFDNGLAVIGAKNDETPTAALRLSIKSGHRFEKPEQAGIAALTASLMNESTEKYSAEELSNEMEVLGSSIDVSAHNEDIVVSVSSLTKHLDRTLELTEEILLRPKFSQEDFERLKNQQLESIANQVTQPTVIADNVYDRLLYGDGHIMSIPVIGTMQTVQSITLDDVKAYYEKMITPSVARLVVVGDVEKDGILTKLEFLKNWSGPEVEYPEEPPIPEIEETKIYLVHKDKAPQSEIRMGYMALPYDATGVYYKAGIMNYILGGAFNSRINLNLREDKGYTYGARSFFRGTKYAGPYTAQAGVRATATDSSVIEFISEIRGYVKDGITEKELKFTKNSLGQRDALKYETPLQKARFLQRVLDYDLAEDFLDKQAKILDEITKAEIDELAQEHLDLDKMVIVVVGDTELVKPGLEKLGYEVVEMDYNNMGMPMPGKASAAK